MFLTFRFYFLTKIFPDSLFINDILFSKYPTTINFLLFVQNIFIFFYLHFVKKFLSRYRYFIRKKKREKNETVSKLKLMIYRFACRECRSHCFVPWFPITMGHHCSLFFNNTPFSGEIASIIKLLFLKRKKKKNFFSFHRIESLITKISVRNCTTSLRQNISWCNCNQNFPYINKN